MPKVAGIIPEATAAAEPLLDPPGVFCKFHGFRVGGGSKLAYAVVTVLPTKIAPAFRSLVIIVASSRANERAQDMHPARVGQSLTSIISLTPNGMPCSFPRFNPDAISFVAFMASAFACCGSKNSHALMIGSISLILSRYLSKREIGVVEPSLIDWYKLWMESIWVPANFLDDEKVSIT